MSWSGHKECIFNAFKYSLGMGELKGLDYGKLKINITDVNFYDVNYRRMKGLKSDITDSDKDMDYNKIRLGELKGAYTWSAFDANGKFVRVKGLSTHIVTTKLTLHNAITDSFNKDTGYTSEASYEQMTNIPASAKIFSYDNNNSWVTGDLDWSITAPSNTSTMEYFKNEYNFNSGYNKTEYQSYGLDVNKLEESVVRLSADSFIMDDRYIEKNTVAMDYGAAGVLLTYEDEERCLTGKNELPVAYFDFGKTLHSNYNFLQVDWHEDGIIKAE